MKPVDSWGNEGFNLDPPRVDPENGEMARLGRRGTGPHRRPQRATFDKGNVLWIDGHVSAETLETLGYTVRDDGVVEFDGKSNRYWHHRRVDEPWQQIPQP